MESCLELCLDPRRRTPWNDPLPPCLTKSGSKRKDSELASTQLFRIYHSLTHICPPCDAGIGFPTSDRSETANVGPVWREMTASPPLLAAPVSALAEIKNLHMRRKGVSDSTMNIGWVVNIRLKLMGGAVVSYGRTKSVSVLYGMNPAR